MGTDQLSADREYRPLADSDSVTLFLSLSLPLSFVMRHCLALLLLLCISAALAPSASEAFRPPEIVRGEEAASTALAGAQAAKGEEGANRAGG